MLQKLKNHAYLALIFFTLTLAQQYGFYAFKGFPIVWLTFGKYLGFLVFFFFFTFAPGFKSRFIILSFLLILNFFQMAHLSYFGTQILPNEIYLLFHELGEVGGTLGAELYHILIPLLFTLVPLAIGHYALRKLHGLYAFKTVPVLLILYALYNPVRTYVTGNTWGRQPSTRELAGMNLYLSLSYCLGKIIPSKLEAKPQHAEPNESVKLIFTKISESKWDNVIVVLGESLTPNHMSLFGYNKTTTPYLESLMLDHNFFHTVGLSSGVSTDISVAFFLNMGYGDAGALKAAKGEHCLFKLAKESAHTTHFLSIQSSEQLRYIAPYLCTASLSDYRSLEDISPHQEDTQAAVDQDLIPKLKDLLRAGNKKFIMLHQRGSHAPWKSRYRSSVAKFKSEGTDQRISDYDNSVIEFDLFWKALNELLAQEKSKTLLIYLSDHGESVGENNKYGHGFLQPTSFEVPIIIQSYNEKLPDSMREMPKYFPQYKLSLLLAHELGWQSNQNPLERMNDFEIYGNDIDGFAGKAAIKYNDLGGYSFKVIP